MAKPTQRSWYLRIVTGALAAMLGLQSFLAITDPYNLYPWSRPHNIFADTNPVGIGPRFMGQIARGSVDTVIAGGSTGMGFLPADVKAQLSGTASVANISYNSPRPEDFSLVADRLAAIPTVKRVLLTIDYSTFTAAPNSKSTFFPFYLFKPNPIDQMRFFDVTAFALAVRDVSNLSWPGALVQERSFARDRDGSYKNSLMRPAVERAASAVTLNTKLLSGTIVPVCSRFPLIAETLAPMAQTLSRDKRRLDVILPPYSLTFYSAIAANKNNNSSVFKASDTLEAALGLRKCVMTALDGIENVFVYAFDDDGSLVEDMANYYDAGHVYQFEWYRHMLSEIEGGRHRLTAANVDAYISDLRRRVLSYTYKNSAVPPEWLADIKPLFP